MRQGESITFMWANSSTNRADPAAVLKNFRLKLHGLGFLWWENALSMRSQRVQFPSRSPIYLSTCRCRPGPWKLGADVRLVLLRPDSFPWGPIGRGGWLLTSVLLGSNPAVRAKHILGPRLTVPMIRTKVVNIVAQSLI